eukprot:3941976-Rhodomonas_salina.4
MIRLGVRTRAGLGGPPGRLRCKYSVTLPRRVSEGPARAQLLRRRLDELGLCPTVTLRVPGHLLREVPLRAQEYCEWDARKVVKKRWNCDPGRSS